MQEVQVELAPFPATRYWRNFFELLDAILSLALAIITLGSRTDLPRGRFVTRWCAKSLPMWGEGALASHLKDASTKRFSAAALCVFLLQLCKYFCRRSVSISAASHSGYFPLICDSDLARWQMPQLPSASMKLPPALLPIHKLLYLQHITLHSFSLHYSIASFSSNLDTNLCAMNKMTHRALKCSRRGKTQNKNEQAHLGQDLTSEPFYSSMMLPFPK